MKTECILDVEVLAPTLKFPQTTRFTNCTIRAAKILPKKTISIGFLLAAMCARHIPY